MALPKDIPTLQALATSSHTRLENAFISSQIVGYITRCTMLPDKRLARSDHILVVTEIDISLEEREELPHPNFRFVDWKDVRERMTERLEGLDAREEINTPGELYAQVRALTCSISEVIEECIPKVGPLPYKKQWWSPLLTEKHTELCRLSHRAYNRRTELGDPVHLDHRAVRRAYGALIDNAKRTHWEGLLASLDEKLILTAHRYTSGDPTDRGQARIPPLKVSQSSTVPVIGVKAKTNEEKSRTLCNMFFPEIERADMSHAEAVYPAPKFKFWPVTKEQIYRVIAKLGPFKVLGPDGIPNILLTRCANLLVTHLGPIYWETFNLDAYPTSWRDSVTVILRKPGKADYTVLNTYWPVAILNTIMKVLSACVTEDLTHAIKTHDLLLRNHSGPGQNKQLQNCFIM